MSARAPGLDERASGVLLHPTSLPGPHGNGDLGPAAYAFADFLAAAGQRWWQMLPIHPPGEGHSPYNADSAFAGSPLLVALEPLAEVGLLRPGELRPSRALAAGRVNYPAAARYRETRLRRAFERFRAGARRDWRRPLAAFRAAEGAWLEDYALFVALKRAQRGRQWYRWPTELRDRRPAALARARERLREEIDHHVFVQFLFDRQWRALRRHCAARGIGLLGDLPIFVALDSADVWVHRDQFFLDARGRPTVRAGVPPDYFSASGQLWGNPLYRWSVLRARGYDWWVARIRATLRRFHAVRLDHFIGFWRYWEVPARARTARRGRFRPGPRDDFFRHMRGVLGRLPFVAEDLGLVIPEVIALRDRFGLPGMRVLQFAFGEGPGANPHLPHNHTRRSVVYTGTHDNDTAVGWFRSGRQRRAGRTRMDAERRYALDYAGARPEEIHWGLIRLAQQSVAHTAIVPAQDLLGLGSEARMNRPGVARGNWVWRLGPGEPGLAVAERLGRLSELYGRTAAAANGERRSG